jgi:hypothetical protein
MVRLEQGEGPGWRFDPLNSKGGRNLVAVMFRAAAMLNTEER